MSERAITAVVTVLIGIVGVAALAVLVSGSSNTANVVKSSTTGFAQALCAALSPIGVKCNIPSVTSGINFGGIVG